jgi:poly(A) polymerase
MAPQENEKVSYLKREPRIIPRGEHPISRDSISPNAMRVLYRLHNAGYQACLVGGSVRDLLLGREPKDFDVATDARPEQVRELFRNCRLIGRRFRLAHVHFGQEIIEVSTFRAPHDPEEVGGHSVDGRIIRDNVYGTMEEDVWRRDFTANALFYNVEDFSVIDYAGGVADIEGGLIRLIGEPSRRYTEDPVRLLRAVRFAAKLGFRIHPDTERPIPQLAHMLEQMPPGRLFEEALKMFMGGYGLQTFEQLRRYGLFGPLFPQTEEILAEEEGGFPHTLLIRALENTDKRVAEGKPVTPGFLVAALLWLPMHDAAAESIANGLPEADALSLAADTVISRQIASTSIPRRFTQMARDIWQLQPRFARREGKRPQRLLQHPKFRAAYDFLLLRVAAGEDLGECADWWTRLVEREGVPEKAPIERKRPKRRRRGGRGRRGQRPEQS